MVIIIKGMVKLHKVFHIYRTSQDVVELHNSLDSPAGTPACTAASRAASTSCEASNGRKSVPVASRTSSSMATRRHGGLRSIVSP